MACLLLCSCRMMAPVASLATTSAVLENTPDEAPAAPTAPAVAPPAAPQAIPAPAINQAPLPAAPTGLPPAAWSGHPAHPTAPPVPTGRFMGQPWSPPGLPRPWPADEYVIDGGDRAGQVNVAQDWTVHGLDEEDTVVHYDTLEGKVIIQPSNRVAVYAPRFAAVRRVDGIVQNEHTFSTLANHQVENLRMDRESQNTSKLTQQLQPRRHLALATPNGFRERLPDRSVDNVQNAAGTASIYESYEDFSIIRRGIFDNNEKPRLNQRIQAAKSWATQQGVQVVLDDKLPTEFVNERTTGEHYTYEMPEGKQRLRVVKVASRQHAHSGDIIEFTVRFDNTGDQTIGNVTVLDNLTPRLEYIPDSQQCNLKSNFVTQINEAQSLVLRWEITDPLKVGEGGVIRFKCRVR
ncbi:MAG: DUF11 domain-containing protein [Pirellulaceae bacterium]|nr:DUF11 domain-containing protein [Pirellulaceae bacterium]